MEMGLILDTFFWSATPVTIQVSPVWNPAVECLIETASSLLFLHRNSLQWHQSSPAESMSGKKKKSLVRPPFICPLSAICSPDLPCESLVSAAWLGGTKRAILFIFFLLSAPEADNTIAFHFEQMAFNWQIKQLMHSRRLPGYCCPSYKTAEETGPGRVWVTCFLRRDVK